MSNRWRQLARGWWETGREFRAGWRVFGAFELFCKLLTVAVYAPHSAWFLHLMLRLAVNANAVTRDLITRAHQADMEVHVWTVNEPAQMLTMIHLGVDNIMTDSPELLVALLAERAKLSNAEKTLLFVADFLAGRL